MSDGDRFLVPWEPTQAMWGGLARDIMMWLSFSDRPTPQSLLNHLRRAGREIPAWLLEEDEMKALDHSMSKGTRVTIIYKAMLEACRREGLERMTAMDDEAEAA
jgi:hypothetical protein